MTTTVVGSAEREHRAVAWLDPDGRHVWFQHECANGSVETMLPHPTWRVDGSDVMPSVACTACGFHNFMVIDQRRTFQARLAKSVEDNRTILDRLAAAPVDGSATPGEGRDQ